MNRFASHFVRNACSSARRSLPFCRSACLTLAVLALAMGTVREIQAEPAGNLASTNTPPAVSGAALDGLLAQLNHASPAKRREALLRLADQQVDAETVLTRVWPLLDDADPFVRAHASRAVWLVGQRPDAAVATLNALLDPRQPQVCALASFLVGEIGTAARPALPALRARMTENDPLLRLHAAEAIAKIDPADAAAHTVLIRALHDQSPDVRYFSACALLTAGTKYREQVRGALLDALSDDDLRVASAAALSLESWETRAAPRDAVGAPQAESPLSPQLSRQVSNLSDASASVRRQAALRLAELEAGAAPAIQSLRSRLEDSDPVVRAYVAFALWQVERRATAVLPTLIDLLGTIRPNVTTLATSVLAQLGPDAADALPSLYDLMETGDPLVRLHVAIAISRIDPRGREAIGILTTAAHDDDSDLRYLATLALGHVSLPLRKRAERELNAALHDRNFRVRAAAELALDHLDALQARARVEARVAAAAAQARQAADEAPSEAPREPSPVVTAVVDDELADATEMIPVIDETPASAPAAQPSTEAPSKEYDLDDETVEERKTIGQLRARIKPSDGDLPIDHAGPHFAQEPRYYHGYGTERGWDGLSFAWCNTGVCHQPLYFQDLNLERYGYHYGCSQWLVSSAKFAVDTALLPYQLVVSPPCDCVYTLGYDRPGNCVPYRCYRLPWRTDAAMVLGGVAVGLFFLAP